MSAQMEAEQRGMSIEQALGVVRRRFFWIVLLAILAAEGALAVSNQQPRLYTATASLVFSNNQEAQQVAGLQAVAVNNQQSQQQTDLKLVQKGDMAERTASELGNGLTGQQVREDIGVSAEGESYVVDVTATARAPKLAAQIANTYATIFVAEQQNRDHAYYASALQLVDKQLAGMSAGQRLSAAGLALAGRAESLGVLAELKSGDVQVVQQASPPTAPSSPQTMRNAMLGAVLGLLLGLGIAFLLERFDHRIRTPKDLEEIYRLPLLGAVSESKALVRSNGLKGGSAAALSPADAEAFHLLRAHLRYFNVDKQLRTIMVVSAAPGDGKTTVSRHLAAAAAQVGSRVLLMEVDLRRPTLSQQIGLPAGRGLTDVLIGVSRFGEAVQTIPVEHGAAINGRGADRSLDVLVSGMAPPPNPAELIESHAMVSLLEHVSSLYDLVVIDTPPLTAVSDAFPLLREVDGVIVVGRVGRKERGLAERLRETLKGVDAPLLGVVANGVRGKGLSDYSYAYAYPVAPTSGAGTAGVPSANGSAPDEEALHGSPS